MPTQNTSSPVSTASLTGDHNIDSLIYGQRWASSTISYSLPGNNASWSLDPTIGYGTAGDNGEPWHSFSPLDAIQAAQFKVSLQQWANVADLQFVQCLDDASTVGDIRVAFTLADAVKDAQA